MNVNKEQNARTTCEGVAIFGGMRLLSWRRTSEACMMWDCRSAVLGCVSFGLVVTLPNNKNHKENDSDHTA